MKNALHKQGFIYPGSLNAQSPATTAAGNQASVAASPIAVPTGTSAGQPTPTAPSLP
jgi:hypothetical protein